MKEKSLKILVLGSGGREHALCWKITQSPLLDKLYCAPGNGGIESVADCVTLDIESPDAVLHFAKEKAIDLVVIGPEGPLVSGLVDTLIAENIAAFGPVSAAAQLEGSKGFMKDLCKQNGIPTADYARFDNKEEAINYLNAQPLPIVIKADGLAAGKGVTVADTKKMAEQAINDIFDEKFGANMDVVIEEFMDGEEASYFVCCDGEDFVSLESAQDHKRIGENDTGPNTGGMGAYSPAPIFTPKIKEQVDREIITPTLNALKKNGHPYKGILYAGLMIKDGEIKVLEFNCRFGDPETQPILLRLKSSLVELCLAAINDELESHEVEWTEKHSCGVVIASQGYPESYESNKLVSLPENTENETKLFHAGTKLSNNEVLTSGGRVFCATALGDNLKEAQTKAYNLVDKVSFEGAFFRKDIGFKGIK